MGFELSGQHFGTFDLHGQKVFGELRLDAAESRLALRTEAHPAQPDLPGLIHGQLHDLRLVSCIDCVGGSEPRITFDSRGPRSYSWNLFPHFALIGDRHFDPESDKITEAWFSVSDGALIFDDFDSYGVVLEPPIGATDLIPKCIGNRQVPHGPNPKLAYFAGRSDILDIAITDGSIKVQHWPIFDMGSSEGVRLGSELKLGIHFSAPTELFACIKAILNLTQFLSLVAGRSQGVSNVQIQVTGTGEKSMPLSMHWSFAPSPANAEQELDKPSFLDMPLDPIRRSDEFSNSLSSWWKTSPAQGLARNRLYSCRARENQFDTDRMVAAANMFDLRITHIAVDTPADLAQVCKESVIALKKLPKTDDRDSAIMALKRVGAPSLRKKVLARAAVVKSRLSLDNLDEVLRIAIRCRNYFVHGGGDQGFDYTAVEPFTTFLTETLEFVFAAAELIEGGWDGSAWRRRPHTSHHWFTRYLKQYSEDSNELLLACGKDL